jgi:hypothetical protein
MGGYLFLAGAFLIFLLIAMIIMTVAGKYREKIKAILEK